MLVSSVDTLSGTEVRPNPAWHHLVWNWDLGLGFPWLIWDPVHFVICHTQLFCFYVFFFLCKAGRSGWPLPPSPLFSYPTSPALPPSSLRAQLPPSRGSSTSCSDFMGLTLPSPCPLFPFSFPPVKASPFFRPQHKSFFILHSHNSTHVFLEALLQVVFVIIGCLPH